MPEPLITHMEKTGLLGMIMEVNRTKGIANQITHLYQPDDNEDYDAVFYYIETEILDRIERWTHLLQSIHKIRLRM